MKWSKSLKKTLKTHLMMGNKLYFKSIDDTQCYSLQDHLIEAAEEELDEVTLVEAVPDDGTSGYIWCSYDGQVAEKNECKKAFCPKYESKGGCGVCSKRGKLYLHGTEETFKVNRS